MPSVYMVNMKRSLLLIRTCRSESEYTVFESLQKDFATPQAINVHAHVG